MRAATCFSGIGAPEVGGPQYDWIWSAEVEKFPSAVLRERHPSSLNLGDVLAPDFIERAKAFGPLDLMAGGPPCQGFSFAGLRGSMDDPRGLLSLQWVNILHAIQPRNAITENVPGWLSTDDNAFGCFLGAVIGSDAPIDPPAGGKWPRVGMASGPRGRTAWRVFDAQYFGLAQRRERVFAVSDFGEGADPAAVLFERQSVSGNFAPRRGEGQGVAGTLSARTKGGGGLGTDFDLDGGLIADVDHTLKGEGHDASEDGTGRGVPIVPERWPADIAPTLNASFGDKLGLENQHIDGGAGLFVPARAIGFPERLSGTQYVSDDGISPALGAINPTAVAFSIHSDAIGRDGKSLTPSADAAGNVRLRDAGLGIGEDVSYNITTGQPHAVAFDLRGREGGAQFEGPHDTANIRAASGGSSKSHVCEQWAVRRLTPTECERLQGFPDGYTLIEHGSRRTVEKDEADYLAAQGATVTLDNEGRYRTNAAADGPRYKALGNSWAVHCGAWIIDRIHKLQTGQSL